MATAFQNVVTKVRSIGVKAAAREFTSLAAAKKAAGVASDSLSRSGKQLIGTLSAQTAATNAAASAAGRKAAAMTADSVSTRMNTQENIKNAASQASLAAAADSAAFSFGRVSLNVFSFTIALKDMATQIPILVTGLGSLLSVVIALGSAAVVAGAGLAGMITGGLIQMAGDLQDKYEDIEGTMEAIQAIGEAVRDLFVEALSPLVTPENAAMTKTLIEDVAGVVHSLATAIDNLMIIGDDAGILPLMRNLADIFQEGLFGGGDTTGIINQLGHTFQQLQGPLEDTARVLTNTVAPAIEFFTDITLKLIDSGSTFVKMLGDWLRAAVELGSTVADGFLPVLTTLLAQTMHLIDAVNSINPELVSLVAQFATAAAMVKFLTGPLSTLAGTLDLASRSVSAMFFRSQTLTESLGNMTRGFTRMTAAVMPGILDMGQSFMSVLDQMGLFNRVGLQSVSKGLENLDVTIREIENGLDSFGDVMTAVATGEIEELQTAFDDTFDVFRFGKVVIKDAAASFRNLGSSIVRGTNRGIDGLLELSSFLRTRVKTAFLETAVAGQNAMSDIQNTTATGSHSIKSAYDAVVNSLFRYNGGLADLQMQSGMAESSMGAVANMGEDMTDMINNSATGLEALKLNIRAVGGSLKESFIGGLVTAQNALFDFRGSVTGLLPTVSKYEKMANTMNQTLSETAKGSMTAAIQADGFRSSIGHLIDALMLKVSALWKNITAENALAKVQFLRTNGLRASIAATWAYIKALGVKTAALLTSTAAAIGLNAALGGIPLLIGVVVSAIAALGGAIVALGGPSDAWSTAIGGIREALGNMVEFLLKETVPIFNSMMTILRAIMDPISSLINGVFRIGEALGILSDEGGAGASTMNLLTTTVSTLITPVEIAWGVLASLANIIGTLAGLIIDRLVGGIVNTINGLQGIAESIFNIAEGLPVIGRLIEAFRTFRSLIAEIPGMLSAIPAILTDVMEDVVNTAIAGINRAISAANTVPGVDISEVGEVSFDTEDTITTDDVDEALEAEEDEDMMDALDGPTEFNADLDLTQETSVSGTFNMAPEEEERVKRLVEDAVEDANQFRRRREGAG